MRWERACDAGGPGGLLARILALEIEFSKLPSSGAHRIQQHHRISGETQYFLQGIHESIDDAVVVLTTDKKMAYKNVSHF